MLSLYPQIKLVHITFVLASGALFALRGLLVQLGHKAAHWRCLRWMSYAFDTTLLAAAIMLLTILPGAMFANGWLTAKLALLALYVVFGTLALKRVRTIAARRVFYVLALLTYINMLGIARMHQPLGWLYAWFT